MRQDYETRRIFWMRAQEFITNNEAVLFSKSYCPYCDKAKNLLKSINFEYQLVELDKEKDGKQMQDFIEKLTKEKGVPMLFYKHEYFGDDGDIQEKLEKLRK